MFPPFSTRAEVLCHAALASVHAWQKNNTEKPPGQTPGMPMGMIKLPPGYGFVNLPCLGSFFKAMGHERNIRKENKRARVSKGKVSIHSDGQPSEKSKGREKGAVPSSAPQKSPARGVAMPTYKIFVRDLELTGLIGIHPHEHDAPQRVLINIEITAQDNCSDAQDDIANVLSYEDIVNGVKEIFAQGHVGLVETLAEEIAEMALENERTLMIRVRAEKLDVFEEAKSVGIEIERRAKASTDMSKVVAFGSLPPGDGDAGS